MKNTFTLRPTALAVFGLASACALMLTTAAQAADKAATKKAGTYVTGDFHNHSTCSDGSLSLQKLVDKSTGNKTGAANLDWFVQADHGGSSAKNCTIAEDPFEPNTPALGLSPTTTSNSGSSPTSTLSSTSTSPYPKGGQDASLGKGPNQTWANTQGVTIKGDTNSSKMWRWQEIKEYQYAVLEKESRTRQKPIWIGSEMNAPGHEHVSTTILDGQLPWPATTGTGNANLMAQHEYCFDRSDTDTSRGSDNQWDCTVANSANNSQMDGTAKKILGNNGTTAPDAINRGHMKSVEAVKWLKEKAPNTSYYIPAHIERAGFYQSSKNKGTDIEHFREYNNTASSVAFGVEFMPGHQASVNRGEFSPTFNSSTQTDVNAGSAGTGSRTYGGTGYYAATIGGVWDALLGEGRNFWFFASSDYHNRGIFGPDQLESTQDFYPGEYTKMHVMARKGSDSLNAQAIMDGLRSGNLFVANGGLVDRMSFVVCAYNPVLPRAAFKALVEKAALNAATSNNEVRINGCATMGEKLKVRKDADLLVTVVVRNPETKNNSPYSFPNPSLAQLNITQALDKPVLDHVDVIWGQVTSTPLATQTESRTYDSTSRLDTCIKNAYFSCGDLTSAAATNATTIMAKRFYAKDWTAQTGGYKVMSYKVSAGSKSQYFRLRGTNLPVSTPNETDANGNPLIDDSSVVNKIECTDANCPSHLNNANGKKYSSYDVSAWADLWFYSNPIYIQVLGGTDIASVK